MYFSLDLRRIEQDQVTDYDGNKRPRAVVDAPAVSTSYRYQNGPEERSEVVELTFKVRNPSGFGIIDEDNFIVRLSPAQAVAAREALDKAIADAEQDMLDWKVEQARKAEADRVRRVLAEQQAAEAEAPVSITG